MSVDEDEAEAVAEILGAPRFARKLADLTREIPGLHSEPVRLPATSSFVGRQLGETHCRTVTGASIVAIVRARPVAPGRRHPGDDRHRLRDPACAGPLRSRRMT